MVYEQKVEQIPVRVCRMVSTQQTVRTPRIVEKRIPVSYTIRTPRTVVLRIPVDPCGLPSCSSCAPASYYSPTTTETTRSAGGTPKPSLAKEPEGGQEQSALKRPTEAEGTYDSPGPEGDDGADSRNQKEPAPEADSFGKST